MGLDGLLVVDKPAGCTSHDVVARCRRALSEKKVGHGGTLDPDATGVLLLGVGRVTRLLRFLTPLAKTYMGEMVLGTSTDTLDASGRVTGTWDMSRVTTEQVKAAAAALTGELQQVPPMVSAVQVGGRRLHQLAREGVEVERRPRPVTVWVFEVEPAAGPAGPLYRFRVQCSSGTYVRSLVDDLGRALGGGAHLSRLRRTAVGPFDVDGAVSLDEVEPSRLAPPARAVSFLDSVLLDAAARADASQGRPLDRERLGATGSGPWAALDEAGDLVGVYEAAAASQLRAAVILQPANAAGPGG
ncbi:MAG TPA: tRNA pseudouridine(55) synthase TruB [Acidimicrobiales bacterium]|nr:tRNA pseudouridine(55) synthase TruB [Acidimicrobiales bacterium]